MNKFIFVCYEHGTGGESLSVEISRLPFCETLRHEKHSARTWTFDCFHKLFLRNFNDNWKQIARRVNTDHRVRVVPSHYRPEELKKLFPNEIFVVINSPVTQSDMKKLLKRIYKQVWLTKHQRLDQKIGYFIQNCGRKPNREQVKRMAKPITNGGIQCLINEKEINKHSIKDLFRRWANDFKPSFHYHNGPKIITIEYADRNTKSIQDIKSKLTYLVSTV